MLTGSSVLCACEPVGYNWENVRVNRLQELHVRVLITGMGGFAGSHLADYLLTLPGIEVFGTVYRKRDLVRHLEARVQLRHVDLLDKTRTEELIDEIRPDVVAHLAGQADVGHSWQMPWRTFELNTHTLLNVLTAVDDLSLRVTVLVVGSNEEYGLVQPEELPLNESVPFRPLNPYGVSKVAQDMLGLQFYQSNRVQAVRVRPFNHIGPRQRPNFVVSAFALQIARIEAGLQPPQIRVGNLSAKRDFTDVRDMVKAYWLALTKGVPGEVYNLGSGEPHSIQEVLDLLLSESKMPIRVSQDLARMRPADVPETRCDASKFRNLTGWSPTIPFHQSVMDTLNYWREQVREGTVVHG